MAKPLIAVSGKNGQLGWELERLAASYADYDFIFCDKDRLDISDYEKVSAFFSNNKLFAFINCAAYTAVDKAETEKDIAYLINADAVGFLAKQCSIHNVLFVTFSTDYVFDGNGTEPYSEIQPTAPLNYYGYTKSEGEKLALKNCRKAIIIRTSWVYSDHGNNFVKTMLRLMKEKEEINVVNDQVGSPTYAKDLAEATMKILKQVSNRLNNDRYGIYHYSNEGVISWFDFAVEIKRITQLNCNIKAIPSTAFPTPAKRPKYSVLSKKRISENFDISLLNWKDSLYKCIEALYEKSSH